MTQPRQISNSEIASRRKSGEYIGQRLRHLRTDLHPEKSIEQMADIAGVSPQAWEAFENLGVIPEEHVWKRLQKANFDIGYVLTGDHIHAEELFADELMLIAAYRKLDNTEREALCNLASSCVTADEIRRHPLTAKKQTEAVDRHMQFNEVVGVVVHHNSGVIHSNISAGRSGEK